MSTFITLVPSGKKDHCPPKRRKGEMLIKKLMRKRTESRQRRGGRPSPAVGQYGVLIPIRIRNRYIDISSLCKKNDIN